MKDITKEFGDTIKLQLDNLGLDKTEFREKELEKIIAKVTNAMRVYEIEDVKDIFNNYHLISKRSSLDLNQYGFNYSVVGSLILHQEFQNITGFSLENSHLNICQIYDVNLLDIKFKENNGVKWIEYGVQDKYQKQINAMSIYHIENYSGGLEKTKEKLGMIVESSSTTKFHIIFQACIDTKRLYSLGIYRSDDDNGEDDVPSSFENINSFKNNLIGVR